MDVEVEVGKRERAKKEERETRWARAAAAAAEKGHDESPEKPLAGPTAVARSRPKRYIILPWSCLELVNPRIYSEKLG